MRVLTEFSYNRRPSKQVTSEDATLATSKQNQTIAETPPLQAQAPPFSNSWLPSQVQILQFERFPHVREILSLVNYSGFGNVLIGQHTQDTIFRTGTLIPTRT